MDQITEFENAMAERNLNPGNIMPDGNIYRFSVDGDKRGEKSGAYYHNGSFGWFQNWREMDKPEIIKSNLSKNEKGTLAGTFNDGSHKVSPEVLEAAIRNIWDAGTEPNGHPYLDKKQVRAVDQTKQYEGDLLIPVMGINGQLNGLQRIDSGGKKRFLPGTRKKGSFFPIKGSDTYIVTEGLATGISIHQATGYSVLVAFDAGNLLTVAKQLCKKVDASEIIIAGDNDSWKLAAGKRDIGGEKAKKAAAAIVAKFVVPTFKTPNGKQTTDFNDLHRIEGLERVKTQIDNAKFSDNDFNSIKPVDIFGDTSLAGKPVWPKNACPKVFEDFAFDAAERIGVDPEMITIPAIVCAAIAIPDNFKIQPKLYDTSWTEPPILWATVIADPGQKKSPALLAATKAIKKIQFQYKDDYEQENAIYDREKRLFEAKSKQERAELEAPKPPKMRRIWKDDITVESLRQTLSENPLGVGIIKDELTGWISSFDNYKNAKSGSKDKPDYCELFQGSGKVFDRIGNRVFVPNWGASILGGIQPGPISRLMGKITDDGLLARFIVYHAGRNNKEVDRAPQLCCKSYEDVIKRLPDLKPRQEGEYEIFKFNGEGIAYREKIRDLSTYVMLLPDTTDALKAHLNKWEAIFSRICLVYHIVDAVCNDEYPSKIIPSSIPEMALRLMFDFLLPNSVRFYHETLDDGQNMNHAKWIAGLILTKKLGKLTPREIERAYRHLRNQRKLLFNTMNTLSIAGWVKKKEDGKRVTWRVNPIVHRKFAKQAELEKKRRGENLKKAQQAFKILGLTKKRGNHND
jgi:phage/plasmid primase-like uncharacterized protein